MGCISIIMVSQPLSCHLTPPSRIFSTENGHQGIPCLVEDLEIQFPAQRKTEQLIIMAVGICFATEQRKTKRNLSYGKKVGGLHFNHYGKSTTQLPPFSSQQNIFHWERSSRNSMSRWRLRNPISRSEKDGTAHHHGCGYLLRYGAKEERIL